VGRRLTRKQIRNDEFISAIDRWIHWVGNNWRQAAIGLGGAALIGIFWWIGSVILTSRSMAASEALGGALDTYNAPVGKDAPADAKLKFANDSERLAAAEKAFTALKSKYSMSKEAKLATLFLARIAADRGDAAKAISELGELTSRKSGDDVSRLAMLALVKLRLDKGEAAALVPELQDMADGKDARLPQDMALFELGKVLEKQGKSDDAAKAYRKLVEQFPESAYRQQAQTRLGAVS
jgi:predicted negative regulator of RcsB-dependent stress response